VYNSFVLKGAMKLRMKNIWIGTQIFIGEKEIKDFSIEYIKKRIVSAKRYLNLNSLIVRTNYDNGVYENLIKICREYEIDIYLWFTVLADIQDYEIRKEELVTNYKNKQGYGQIGRWDKLGIGDEKFLFICPNNEYVMDNISYVLKNLLNRLDFDGVFFDRIRYPSCVNGFESFFTCFCDSCKEKFYNSYGFSLDSYRKTIDDFLDNLKQITVKELNGWNGLESLWDFVVSSKFIEFKNMNIYTTVKRFSDYVKSKNKKVGLDLYSISLAQFVSQDYKLLSKCCDWIKPMIYCHALGPAGIPLEISCLIRALRILCPKLSENVIINFFNKIFDNKLPENENKILKKGILEEFVSIELAKIKKLKLSKEVQIYPGVETVKIPQFSTYIDKKILEKYLSQIKQEVTGFIASWNLLYIPDDNLEIIGNNVR